jgi:uncharacterized protein (DUF924 family)
MSLPPEAQAVLDFWFLPTDHFQHGHYRLEWFRKDDAFDATIREQFGAQVELVLAGGLAAWDATPHGALARILLLDQFTRNIFRNTPRAFAGDMLALDAAQRMVAMGTDKQLGAILRWFVYLPFEHSEALAMQEQSMALFRDLQATAGKPLCSALDYADRHHQVIARFGRFPHRNAILGRESTTEEIEALKQPGFFF